MSTILQPAWLGSYKHPDAAFRVTDDPDDVDFDMVHQFITKSYWARGISRETLQTSMSNCMNFCLLDFNGAQIGYARVLSDFARTAHIADIFVLEGFRGKGLGLWFVESVMAHEKLRNVLRWTLRTDDAQPFYSKLGFETVVDPSSYMYLRRS